MHHLQITVCGHEDSDAEERAALARSLAEALHENDSVARVEVPRYSAPPDAKGTGIDLAALAITAVGGLPGLIAFMEAWRGRQRAGTIVIEIDGDRLELTDVTDEERARAIDAWVQRHGGADD